MATQTVTPNPADYPNKGFHIHQWGCVNCGDTKICSKCMEHDCVFKEAKKQLRLAKMGKGWLDVYYLDELIDKGYTVDQLVGVNVDWHGTKAVVVKRPDGWKPLSGQPQKYVVALRTRVSCYNRCGHRVTITVKSGVHKGAFCIAIDRNGNRLADLRDCVTYCETCRS